MDSRILDLQKGRACVGHLWRFRFVVPSCGCELKGMVELRVGLSRCRTRRGAVRGSWGFAILLETSGFGCDVDLVCVWL